MQHWLELFITIMASVLASSGFWALIQKRFDSNDAKTRMILGLGHDRLTYLALKYIERGWITKDEFDDFTKYIWEPYRDMGGNGTGERLYNEVKKLPIKSGSATDQEQRTVFMI